MSTPVVPAERLCRVRRITEETAAAVSYELAPADGRPLPPYLAGQHIAVHLPDASAAATGMPPVLTSPTMTPPIVTPAAAAAPPVRRCLYSLSRRPGASPWYRITVRDRVPSLPAATPASTAASPPETAAGCPARMRRLIAGAQVAISEPAGTFVLPESGGPLVLVSAGAGITPVFAMLDTLAHARDRRRIWFIHSATAAGAHIFRDEVRTLAGSLPRVTCYTVYTRPQPADAAGHTSSEPHDSRDRLTAARLRTLVPAADAEFLICGPPAFVQSLHDGLIDLGVPPARVRTEAFGVSPRLAPLHAPPLGPRARPDAPPSSAASADIYSVRFARSGLAVAWDDRQASLLDLAEASGLRPDYYCRAGICGTCDCDGSGPVTYSVTLASPPARGRIRICCARPAGPVTLDL